MVGTDNWYGTIPSTTVYFPPRLEQAAKMLALDLGVDRTAAALLKLTETDAVRLVDTAAALVTGGRRILSSVVHGQTALHADFGGVVPEIAARAQGEQILLLRRHQFGAVDRKERLPFAHALPLEVAVGLVDPALDLRVDVRDSPLVGRDSPGRPHLLLDLARLADLLHLSRLDHLGLDLAVLLRLDEG